MKRALCSTDQYDQEPIHAEIAEMQPAAAAYTIYIKSLPYCLSIRVEHVAMQHQFKHIRLLSD